MRADGDAVGKGLFHQAVVLSGASVRAGDKGYAEKARRLRRQGSGPGRFEYVLLFMKGTPSFVMCGNSDRALQALRRAGAPVTAIDILPDPQIRQELSAISGWPTIPQVFVKGELVGGADIVEELEQSGELARRCARSSVTTTPPGGTRRRSPLAGEHREHVVGVRRRLYVVHDALYRAVLAITKVERLTPRYVRPMYFFSPHTP